MLIGDSTESSLNKLTPEKSHVSHWSNCLFVTLWIFGSPIFFSGSMLTNIDQAGSHLQTILTDDFNEEYSSSFRDQRAKSNSIHTLSIFIYSYSMVCF